MKVKKSLSAEVLGNCVTITDMEALIADARALGFSDLDRIWVDYHKGDYRDPRESDWMTLKVVPKL